MSAHLKNFFVVVGIISLLLFIGILNKYVNTYATSIQPSSFRSFTTTGEGKVVAVPDVAQFSFGVTSEGGMEITKLQGDNTKKMNAAIEFLKGKGIDAKDIKTEQYNLQPRMEYGGCYKSGLPCPPPKIVGYTISQSVTVKIRQFEKIGDAMSGIAALGVNSVSQLNFTIDDPKKLQSDARTQAIADAKIKAEAIAQAGGFRLGRLLSIEEGVKSPPMPMMYGSAMMRESLTMDAIPAPTIEAGSQDVAVNVTLKYEIQ